jgi:hypothetical protein
MLFLLFGCGTETPEAPVAEPVATPISEVVVAKVDADLAVADPAAAFWSTIPPGAIELIAQPMVAPRPESTTTETIAVQAAHDGTTIAFRMHWNDTELSEAGRLAEYSDAVAIQFPISGDHLPPVMMGATDDPVHIYHWRAQYQRDMERGKPTVMDLYPNASVDMYPMDFVDAPGGSKEDKENFNPAIAAGNPQSYSKTGVDEIIAEGFSTSSVLEGSGGAARGVWRDGTWTVVITRPLVVEGGSTIVPGAENALTFAVWQGGLGEVGSRKCLKMAWIPLQVTP